MTAFNDFRTSYVIGHLNKGAHKQTETFCIVSILSKVENFNLKPVFQQAIMLDDGKHALVDLYFPAIKYGIEINENYHMGQVEHDEKRNSLIRTKAGIALRVVDCNCDQTLETISSQCDVVAKEIKEAILKNKVELGKWDITPAYYLSKGVLDCSTNDYFTTIDDICTTFHTKQKKHGFLAEGGGHKLEDGTNTVIVWPKSNGNAWKNIFNSDFTEWHEFSPDKSKNAKNFAKQVAENSLRVVFYKYKDVFGKNCYKYVGDFKLDIPESKKAGILIWLRVSTKHVLSKK